MTKTPTLEERLAAARRPERVVDVYLRGDLRAEWDDIQAKLTALGDPTSLADTDRATLVDRARRVEAEFEESRLSIRLRALNRTDASALATETGDDGEFGRALLARAVVDPALTADQLGQLADALSAGDFARLVAAAQELTFGATTVPFSRAGSANSRS